jgi:DNA (cytosine-5)-methyltransferase 1
MKLVDLFCGCGGFSLGAHKAGFEVATAFDIDETLTSSYRINFPRTQLLHRDIGALSSDDVRHSVKGEILGIFGGPPCQGFSAIGRRAKDDPRRELLTHFFRIVAGVAPVFFVMENVRGLAYPEARPILDDALQLVLPSYHILGPVTWDAASFGAATKRQRMFVIGMRKDASAPMPRSFIEKFKAPSATVRSAIADLSGAKFLGDAQGFDQWKIQRRGAPSGYASTLRAENGIFTGHRPTVHTDQVVERFSKVLPGEIDAVGRHPRLKWDGQCPTLRAGTGSDKGSYQSVRPIHPYENRVITVREAARLQGFPDDHIFHPTVWHSFRMIGNSVSPIIATAIFKSIRLHLSESGVVNDFNSSFADAAE